MLHITCLMNRLARERPIFHSEADFQHALAWRIHHDVPDCDVRLEYKPFPDKGMYLDLWLPIIGVAIELKYLTRKLNHEHDREVFALKDQSAQDLRRYDFLRDIERLESVVALPHVQAGVAILLTNDPSYWNPPPRPDRTTNDYEFRLHEDRTVGGDMAWSERAGAGTIKGREEPICLKGSYNLQWQDYTPRDYTFIEQERNRQFRYLMVHVAGVSERRDEA